MTFVNIVGVLADPSALQVVLVGALGNAALAILGCYLLLRRMSLLGDAISHALLPGIVVGYLWSGGTAPLVTFAGAMAFGLLTTFLTQTLGAIGPMRQDTSLGVVFTSLFAVGVLLLSQFAGKAHIDVGCVFEGDILHAALDPTTVSVLGAPIPRMLATVGLGLALTLIFVTLFWKELQVTAFDTALAQAMGMRPVLVHYLLMAMVAGVAVSSFESLGSILVIAMLVTPPATASLLTDRLGVLLAISASSAVVATVAGYVLAVAWDTSVAGMMAVSAGALFTITAAFAPRYGILGRIVRRWALAVRIRSEDILAAQFKWEESATGTPQSRLPSAGWLVHWLADWRLKRRGLLASDNVGRVRLTETGKTAAVTLVRSHRLWEAFLGEHFELPLDHLHDPASAIEHYITPEIQNRLANELSQPGADPHGRPIPAPDTHS